MLDIALQAAKAGSAVAQRYFKHIPKVSFKPDNSPVTIADKTAELAIRRVIARKFPDHGIIGEEHPATNPESEYQWCIDPIDGTKQFIRKIPVWGTFVGLMKNKVLILGTIIFPCMNEIYWAQKGKGAFLNGRRVHVSRINKLSNATMAHGTMKRFEKHGVLAGLTKLDQETYSQISLGPYTIGQLIQGHIDINLDGGGKVWDFAAPSIIIEEAGGRFSDFSGRKSFDSNCSVMTNGLLHSKVISILNNK